MDITTELKAQFFPLLDDTGGMEEIYELTELVTRASVYFSMLPHWRAKWAKGISFRKNAYWDSEDLYYHDVLVARKHRDGKYTMIFIPAEKTSN